MIMKRSEQTYFNVYLSHSVHDAAIADVVVRKLTETGLTAFRRDRASESREDLEEAIRQAIWECAALVVIGTPTYLDSPTLLFEAGAAWGAHKPIFILVDSQAAAEVPIFLKRFRHWPMSRLDRVIDELVELARPLSEDHQRVLAKTYKRVGVPSDKLLMDAEKADRLTRIFNEQCQTHIPEETLLRELLRMRKQGKLPRLVKK